MNDSAAILPACLVVLVGAYCLLPQIIRFLQRGRKKAQSERIRTEEEAEQERARLQDLEEVRKYKAEEKRRKMREKREHIRNENRELIDEVAAMVSSCGTQAAEIMLATQALTGGDVTTPEELFLDDIERILRVFLDTSNQSVEGVGRLYVKIRKLLSPSAQPILKTPGPEIELRSRQRNDGVKKPKMVPLLDMYDRVRGTHLASSVALSYLSVVSAAAAHCGDSLAVRLVTEAYTALLRPHILKRDGDGKADHSYSSSSGRTAVGAECEKCASGYRVISLPVGAPEGEVRSRRRVFAEFLHPDQLGSKSDEARHAAEQQLMNVNEACDHILQCKFARL